MPKISCLYIHLNPSIAGPGGCYLGDIDKETSLYGLMVPLGHAPVTGMGLALNGGVGIGTRIFGSTAEHIMAATVVTADGVVVSAQHSSGSHTVC